MKIALALIIGIAIGHVVTKQGPHKIIGATSNGLQMASKAVDNVNKKIGQ